MTIPLCYHDRIHISLLHFLSIILRSYYAVVRPPQPNLLPPHLLIQQRLDTLANKMIRNKVIISVAIPRDPMIEKTVKPYDAAWNSLLTPSLSVVRPSCIAVSITTTKTNSNASQAKSLGNASCIGCVPNSNHSGLRVRRVDVLHLSV
jgi:hypothetical protein